MGVTKLQADQLNVTAGPEVSMLEYREYVAEFVNSAIDDGWSVRNSGASSGVSLGLTGLPDGTFGAARFSTGTDTSGFAGVSTNDNTTQYAPVSGDTYVMFSFVTSASLSDGTNRYTIRLGLNESNAGLGNDHLVLEYADNLNSGNFRVVMGIGGANVATINTSLTVAVSTRYYGYIKMTGASQEIDIVINGSSRGTATPSSTFATGNRVTPIAVIVKSLGTTNRTVDFDTFGIIMPR